LSPRLAPEMTTTQQQRQQPIPCPASSAPAAPRPVHSLLAEGGLGEAKGGSGARSIGTRRRPCPLAGRAAAQERVAARRDILHGGGRSPAHVRSAQVHRSRDGRDHVRRSQLVRFVDAVLYMVKRRNNPMVGGELWVSYLRCSHDREGLYNSAHLIAEPLFHRPNHAVLSVPVHPWSAW
jgi:hypothetical protein